MLLDMFPTLLKELIHGNWQGDKERKMVDSWFERNAERTQNMEIVYKKQTQRTASHSLE